MGPEPISFGASKSEKGEGGRPTLCPFLSSGPVGEYQRYGARKTELPIFKTVFTDLLCGLQLYSKFSHRKLGESRSLHGDLLFFLLRPWFSPWLLLGFGSPFFALLQEKNRTLCRPPPPPPPHERSKGEFLGQNPSFPPSFLLPTSASKKRISGKRKAGEQKRAACVCSGHLLRWVRSLTTYKTWWAVCFCRIWCFFFVLVGLRINESDLVGSFWAAFSFMGTRDRNKIRCFFPACIGDPFFPVSPSLSISNSIMWGSQKRMKLSFPLFPYFTSVKKEKDLFWIFAFCFFCPFLMRARILQLDN